MNMFGSTGRRRAGSRVAIAATCAAATIAAAAAADPARSQPSTPATATIPGVLATTDGWLHFTDTLTAAADLTGAHTSTIKGTLASGGSCSLRSSAGTGAALGATATYEEEVAFNPATCTEQLVTGTLTPAGASALAAQQPAATAGLAPLSVAGKGAAAQRTTPQGVSPNTTQYQTAHVKTAWIDPVNITITSLADNLRWPLYGAGGTLTARVNPYDFKYDGWSSTGPSPIKFVTRPNNSGWSVRETDHFTNTDFASLVFTVFGPAGWAACGFPRSATAHFNHDVTVDGYRNNTRNRAWNDNVSGACSDLVHHRESDGFGWVS